MGEKKIAQYKNRTNRHGQTMKREKERKRIRIAWGSNKTGLGYTVSSNDLMIIKDGQTDVIIPDDDKQTLVYRKAYHIEQSFILDSPNNFSLRKVWLSFTELFVH